MVPVLFVVEPVPSHIAAEATEKKIGIKINVARRVQAQRKKKERLKDPLYFVKLLFCFIKFSPFEASCRHLFSFHALRKILYQKDPYFSPPKIKKCAAEATHRKMHSSNCCDTSVRPTKKRTKAEHAFLHKLNARFPASLFTCVALTLYRTRLALSRFGYLNTIDKVTNQARILNYL